MTTLALVITVDVDNDGVSLANERDRLSWKGIALIPQLAQAVQAFSLPTTWFVRADPQLRDLYGSADFLLTEHRSLWASLSGAGDEIGWHPHIYARDEHGYRPVRDEDQVSRLLRSTHAELLAKGYAFSSVRMGEAIGGNLILQTLAELGLKVDSSAIPGRRRLDINRWFDWSGSPNSPYWPSVADYRVPGKSEVPILEVPMTVSLVHAPFDLGPLPRYTNLAYHPAIFEAALDRWFDELIDETTDGVLTLIAHPDELMSQADQHPLYAFALDALRTNIETVLHIAQKRRIDVVGSTVSGIIGRMQREYAA